jgi:hypothetical protein
VSGRADGPTLQGGFRGIILAAWGEATASPSSLNASCPSPVVSVSVVMRMPRQPKMTAQEDTHPRGSRCDHEGRRTPAARAAAIADESAVINTGTRTGCRSLL